MHERNESAQRAEAHPAVLSSRLASRFGCSPLKRRRATARRTGVSQARLQQSARLVQREPRGRPPCGSRWRAADDTPEQKRHSRRGPWSESEITLRASLEPRRALQPLRTVPRRSQRPLASERTEGREPVQFAHLCARLPRPSACTVLAGTSTCTQRYSQGVRCCCAQPAWRAYAARACVLLVTAAFNRFACELPSAAAAPLSDGDTFCP